MRAERHGLAVSVMLFDIDDFASVNANYGHEVGDQVLTEIGRILSGEPVGNSTKDFSDKYAVLSAELLSELDESQPGGKPKDSELAWKWIERNDAQNYVVLGDPAVRVRVDLLT